jgi:hypothetical protein
VPRLGTAGMVTLAVLGILAAAAPAGLASPTTTATADDDTLVAYLPAGKIKLGKRISYRFQCATDCQVTASSTLLLKGPNLGPAVDTGTFSAGEIGLVFLTLNKSARFAIKSHLGASKLRTSITADNAVGTTDTDTRIFRFKR